MVSISHWGGTPLSSKKINPSGAIADGPPEALSLPLIRFRVAFAGVEWLFSGRRRPTITSTCWTFSSLCC